MSAATRKLHDAVFKRADNHCECGCGRWLGDAGEMDHQAGRARAPQKLSNCWALHRDCHARKTGSDVAILEAFIRHCRRWNYETELARAESRLIFVKTRAELAAPYRVGAR